MTNKPDYGDTLEAQLICDMVAGGDTLIDALRALGLAYSTIYQRLHANPKFREMLEQARVDGYEVIANSCLADINACLEIADDGTNDFIEKTLPDGRVVETLDREHVQRSKLRVDARMRAADGRLKLLAKWHPHKYGEKLQVESTNRNVEIPVSDDPIEAQRAYERLMKGD